MENQELDDLRQEIIKQSSTDDGDLDTAMERQIKFLTVDTSIPKKLADDMWAISDKELVISNFSKDDIHRLRNKRKTIELVKICKMNPANYDFETDFNLRLLDFKAEVKMTRSVGGFERKMQVTQTKNLNLKSTTQQEKKRRGAGTLGRLFGRRQKQPDD